MKKYLAIFMLTLAGLSTYTIAGMETDSVSFAITGTEDTKSTLIIDKMEVKISGRVSFHLGTSPELFEKGELKVLGFNLVHFGVSQQSLTGKKPKGKATGMVGFSAFLENQTLHYNEKSATISGWVDGDVTISQFNEFLKVTKLAKEPTYVAPRQNASLFVEIKLQNPLYIPKTSPTLHKHFASMAFNLQVMPLKEYEVRPYKIKNYGSIDTSLDLFDIVNWKAVKKLCIQPVRFSWISFNKNGQERNSTGSGLEFGMPAARKEWSKAGVIFNVREWISAGWLSPNSISKSVSTLEEAFYELPLRVQVDNCVEIFFVNVFEAEDYAGGGAALANLAIVTSDKLAEIGVDQTHLAHELGHIQGLGHPIEEPPRGNIRGSTGTLMCPSGFAIDNPQINSQDNANNIRHALHTFSLAPRSHMDDPDCSGSEDCGQCP
jgi:hypothetical protein